MKPAIGTSGLERVEGASSVSHQLRMEVTLAKTPRQVPWKVASIPAVPRPELQRERIAVVAARAADPTGAQRGGPHGAKLQGRQQARATRSGVKLRQVLHDVLLRQGKAMLIRRRHRKLRAQLRCGREELPLRVVHLLAGSS